MSTSLRLAQAVQDIEDALDTETDPVARLLAVDHVRADLAQVLTRAMRRSAYEARRDGRWEDLKNATWRTHMYLARMARQYADDSGLPRTLVKDIFTARVLDLDDLALLRGHSR